MKTLLTAILISSLLSVPAYAQTNDPGTTNQVIVPLIVAVIAVAVIGTVIWGLWKMCKRIPTVPAQDPPDAPEPTNYPPSITSIPVNPMMLDTGPNGDWGVSYFGLNGSTNSQGYDALMATDLQSSGDGKDWQVEAHILVWYSTNADNTTMLAGLYDADWTHKATRVGSWRTGLNLGEVLPKAETNRVYRLKTPASLHN